MQANLAATTIGFSETSTAAIVSDASMVSNPEEVGVDFSELVEGEIQDTESATETEIETEGETEPTPESDEILNEGMVEEPTESLPEKKLRLVISVQDDLAEMLDSSKSTKTETLNDVMRQNFTTVSHTEAELQTSVQTSSMKRDNLGAPVSEDAFPDGWEVLLDDTVKGEESKDVAKAVKATLQQSGVIKLSEAVQKTEATEELELPLESDESLSEKKLEGPVSAMAEKGKWIKPLGPQISESLTKPEMTHVTNLTTKGTTVVSETVDVPAVQTVDIARIQELSGDMSTLKLSETFASGVTAASGVTSKAAVQTPAQLLARMDEVQKQMVVKDFVQTTKQGIQGKESQLIVELHPPELGRIRVKLDAQGDQINAQLTMQDRHVGEFFQERLETIRKSLEAAGIRLNDLSLEIKQQFAQETLKEQQDNQDANGFNRGDASHDTVSPKHSASARSAVKLGKVDMVI